MVTPLPVGTVIRTKDQKDYVIEEYIGRGGTSFVYSASHNMVIKEACPGDDRRLERRDMVVVPKHEGDLRAELRLTNCRIRLRGEKEIGESVRVSSSRAVVLWGELAVDAISVDGKEYKPGNSVFCALQNIKGWGPFLSQMIQTRRHDGQPFTIWEIALIVQKILEALAALHREGFVHCDLAPGNIHFEHATNSAMESIGEAFITDFGSAKRIDPKTGRTAPEEEIWSSRRFLAPEMRRGATLTQKADVFAVGLLMLELVDMLPPDQTPRMYDLVGEDLLAWHGATPRAARAGMTLLKGCLQDEEAERFTPAEALAAANELYKAARPPEYRLSNRNLEMAKGLYETVLQNRDEWLRRLDQELERDGPAYLYGMGGIGKTSLALTYAKSRFPERAFRMTFQGSLRRTVADLEFFGFVDTGLDAEQRYREKLELLRREFPSKDYLMVLDNFDSRSKTLFELQDETFRELTALPMRLLITTRSDPDEARASEELRAPTEEAMTAYFQQVVGRELEETELCQAREFVHLVEAHPMTVEIAARCVRAKFHPVSVEKLLAAFRENLKDAPLPGVRLEKDDDHGEHKRTPYEHLKLLFDLSGITDAERAVLCHAALLPEDGMDVELFFECENETEQEALEFLTERSMLQCGEDHRLRIHPLVREVVREELRSTKADCDPFLNRLWDTFDPLDMQRLPLYRQMMRVFVYAHRRFSEEDRDADCAFRAARLMESAMVHLEDVQPLAEYAAEKREKNGSLAGAADVYRFLSNASMFRNETAQAEHYAVIAFDLDCRCNPMSLNALAEDYMVLARSFELFPAYQAALMTSAAALYRAVPAMETEVTAAPELDPVVLSQLLWDDERFPLIPLERTNRAGMPSAKKEKPFSIRTGLQILDVLEKCEESFQEMTEVVAFLTNFHNYCIQPEKFTHLSAQDRLLTLTRIAAVTGRLFPEASCARDWLNIGLSWDEIARSGGEELRETALEQRKAAVLRALSEAERTQTKEDLVDALNETAQVLLDLREYELKKTGDLKKADSLRDEAFAYASRALEESSGFPTEPTGIYYLRMRFEEAGRTLAEWSASAEAREADNLFAGSDADRAWYHAWKERMRRWNVTQMRLMVRKMEVKEYQRVLFLWFLDENAELSYADPTNYDLWVLWLKRQIRTHPDEDVLIPYDIEQVDDRIIVRNAIQCLRCGDVLDSSGGYARHKIRVCSCGACGIDGGSYCLIRLSRRPGREDYRELSVIKEPLEPSPEDLAELSALEDAAEAPNSEK